MTQLEHTPAESSAPKAAGLRPQRLREELSRRGWEKLTALERTLVSGERDWRVHMDSAWSGHAHTLECPGGRCQRSPEADQVRHTSAWELGIELIRSFPCCVNDAQKLTAGALGSESLEAGRGLHWLMRAARERETLRGQARSGARSARALAELVEATGRVREHQHHLRALKDLIETEQRASQAAVRAGLRRGSVWLACVSEPLGSPRHDPAAWARAGESNSQESRRGIVVLRTSTLGRLSSALSWVLSEELAGNAEWALLEADLKQAEHARENNWRIYIGRPYPSRPYTSQGRPSARPSRSAAELALELLTSNDELGRAQSCGSAQVAALIEQTLQAAMAACALPEERARVAGGERRAR